MTRCERESYKRCMRAQCAKLGISVPENANKRQLEAALEAYYKDSVVVHTKNGVELRQSNKPTAEYTVYFSISISHEIRAEDEEAARKWIQECACDFYRPDHGDTVDIGECEIHDVYKAEEA